MGRRAPVGLAAGGFTVLELLIVLAIVAGVFAGTIFGIRQVRKSDLRHDTSHVSVALRIAYNTATQTGKHHRVVFDLDEQTFQVEACEGEIKLRRERREELGLEEDAPIVPRDDVLSELQQVDPHQAMEKAQARAGARIGAAECKPVARPDGRPSKRGRVRSIQRGKDIRIDRIHVQHLEEPAEDGMVTVNFFPLGYAEKAAVVLRDDDDGQFTVLVHASGRIEYREGDWREADSHLMRNALGDTVEDER